uniref:POU domain protein n=1 Tax=Eptatretus burgeri TaxID=7764 RepID=A0A8C4PZE9_EPTBU
MISEQQAYLSRSLSLLASLNHGSGQKGLQDRSPQPGLEPFLGGKDHTEEKRFVSEPQHLTQDLLLSTTLGRNDSNDVDHTDCESVGSPGKTSTEIAESTHMTGTAPQVAAPFLLPFSMVAASTAGAMPGGFLLGGQHGGAAPQQGFLLSHPCSGSRRPPRTDGSHDGRNRPTGNVAASIASKHSWCTTTAIVCHGPGSFGSCWVHRAGVSSRLCHQARLFSFCIEPHSGKLAVPRRHSTGCWRRCNPSPSHGYTSASGECSRTSYCGNDWQSSPASTWSTRPHDSFLQANTAPRVGCGDVDGVNLEEIREFARTFKIRRLSLGLTQTQVGQALSAAQGPAYSQSAICRFEKLDITPKSAQKIKPVLERWMAEAEARQQAGIGSLGNITSGSSRSGGDGGDGAGGVCCDGGTASGIGTTSIMTTGMRDSLKKRKRRTSFTPQALELLHVHFERNTHPSGHEMTEIAEQLHYDREVIRVWFCNKRQALKNTIKRLKQSDRTPSTLQSTAKASAIPQSNSSFNAGNFITAPPHKVTTTGSTGGSARPHPDVGSVGIATFQATSVNDTITCSAQQGSSTLTATSFRADYSSGMLNTSTQNLATLGSTCANAQSINAIPLDSNPAICNLSSSAKSLRSCSSSMQNITQFGIKPVASINAMPSSLLTSNILGLSSTPLSCPSSDLPVPTLTIRMPTPADVPLSPVLCHSFSIGEAIASDNASTASLLGFRSSTPSAVGAVQMSAIPSSNFF